MIHIEEPITGGSNSAAQQDTERRDVHEEARFQIAQGRAVVPLAAKTKRPLNANWPALRVAADQVELCFRPEDNLGVLLGAPSGGLVDVDLDCEEAIALADGILPRSQCETGRAGNPRSHRWFICPEATTRQFRDPFTGEMIVELRSAPLQTVIGPSIHPDGGRYDLLRGQPAHISQPESEGAVEQLAAAVLRQRYPMLEEAEIETTLSGRSQLAPSPHPKPAGSDDDTVIRRARAYLAKMPESVSGMGGHDRAYAAATVLVHGFGLDEATALDVLRTDFNPRCQPPWSENELVHKVSDAARKPHALPLGWLRDRALPQTVRTPALHEERPRIRVRIDTDEHRVVDEAVAGLARDPDLYQRGGVLVDIGWCEVALDADRKLLVSVPFIRTLPPAALRERLTAHIEFYRIDSKGEEFAVHPPPWLLAEILARGVWPHVRPLDAVVGAPILRPDGSILQTPGYDAGTRVLLIPDGPFPAIPEVITKDDAQRALKVLSAAIDQFPFESRAHMATFIAAILTPMARYAFEGPSPMFLVDANVRGVGKTLLCRIVGHICLGRDLAVTSYSDDPAELRKSITTLLIEGSAIVLFDNITGTLGNEVLDRALTGGRWSDRVLGGNTSVNLKLLVTWLASGNNVQLGADTMRRTLHIRLDSTLENPEERSDFRIPNLIEWVRRNRGDLYVAALTILAGHAQAGRPSNGLRRFGSFEGWSDVVREAVVWVGLPDPCLTRQTLLEAADDHGDAQAQLMTAWADYLPKGEGITIADLLRDLYTPETTGSPLTEVQRQMRVAVENFAGGPPGRDPSPRKLGNLLKALRRRVVGGKCLDIDRAVGRRSGAVWKLYRILDEEVGHERTA